MKLPISKIARTAGFTMIELLVVIAVIGVLAVAVLSSINPIEQINKGRDTRTRSDAAQLIGAVDRYYATREIYPWNKATYVGGTDNELPSTAVPNAVSCTSNGADGMCDITAGTNGAWLTELTSTDEVKTGFIERLRESTQPLLLHKINDSNATMHVCFAPVSSAFQDEAVRNCGLYDTAYPTAACPSEDPYTDATEYEDELICLP